MHEFTVSKTDAGEFTVSKTDAGEWTVSKTDARGLPVFETGMFTSDARGSARAHEGSAPYGGWECILKRCMAPPFFSHSRTPLLTNEPTNEPRMPAPLRV